MFFKRLGDHRPCLLQIELAVFGKERSEGRLLGERATGIIGGLEFVNLLSLLAVVGEARWGAQTFHLSMSSVSHGLSLLCVDGIVSPRRRVRCCSFFDLHNRAELGFGIVKISAGRCT